MSKKEDNETNLNEEKLNQKDTKEQNEQETHNSEFLLKKAILIERKTEKKENELLINYDLSNLQYLSIESEEERTEIKKLINNILLSSNFSFMIYAFNKIFGFLKSLLFYNIFYFIGIKLIYTILQSKNEEKVEPKAPIWKRLLLFNLPELIIIFYYHKRRLTKINTAIYSLFSYLNERISYVFNSNKNNNYLCQVDQNNYNIYLIEKKDNDLKKEDIIYINKPEILAQDTFFDSVIAYPNFNFEDFDFNNLTQEEENMFQDIFTLINDIEKKIKEEYSLYNTIGTICSNISFNNSSNYNIMIALALKVVSFFILEIFLNAVKKRKKRNELLDEKEREFNEKNMKNGYFLAVNEYVILLFRIKEDFKNFDEAYNELYQKGQELLTFYFEPVNKIF